MDKSIFLQKLRDFVLSGWDTRKLHDYYCSEKKIYTTHFVVPQVPSVMAPDVFGEPDMESYFFMIHYKGQLVSQEPITFRFWGIGDAYMMINVNGEEVFLDSGGPHPVKDSYFDWWRSTSADSMKYFLSNQRMIVGDWITLEPGKPLEMQVMFGEWLGGNMSAVLNVEVQGVEYEENRQGGPILPAFKTAEFSEDLLDEIYSHLSVDETCLTNGPVFSDYSMPGKVVTADVVEVAERLAIEPLLPSDTGLRTWTMADGGTLNAELVTTLAGKVVLKNPKGKIIKIQAEMLSEKDQVYVQLESPPAFNVSFSKQSEKRFFPDPLPGWASTFPQPAAFRYVFSANLKQSSTGAYNQELQVEFFAIGTEIHGDRYILLDRQRTTFTPTDENNRSLRLSGKTVELPQFMIGSNKVGWDQRGKKYSSFIVVIRDSRGKIVDYKTPKKWLFENLENLEKLAVGNYFDKTCTRVFPTRPKTRYY